MKKYYIAKVRVKSRQRHHMELKRVLAEERKLQQEMNGSKKMRLCAGMCLVF